MSAKSRSPIFISLVIALTLVLSAITQTADASAKGSMEDQAIDGISRLKSQEESLWASETGTGITAGLELQAANCAQWHNILAGETLAKIGVKYGVSWRKLAEINSLKNPNLIYAGSRLCIKTGEGPTPTPTPAPTFKVPTFKINAVTRDQSVTITTANFPAGDTFEVLMGAFGTRGVKGTKVDTVNSGQGGSFTATFNIPANMKGAKLIAIRLQSPTSGYYSYNWFYNTTTN